MLEDVIARHAWPAPQDGAPVLAVRRMIGLFERRAVPNDVAALSVVLPAEVTGNFAGVEGTYDAPIYQQGIMPYFLFGGDIRFEADGSPRRAGTRRPRRI